MIKKIIAFALFAASAALAFMIFTSGRPVLPHIIGPTILISIGAFLLAPKRESGHSPE